jgi:hypothetical protein
VWLDTLESTTQSVIDLMEGRGNDRHCAEGAGKRLRVAVVGLMGDVGELEVA